jgi:hypothetical protein
LRGIEFTRLRESYQQKVEPFYEQLKYIELLNYLRSQGIIDSFRAIPRGYGRNAYELDGSVKIKIAYSAQRLVEEGKYSFSITKRTRDLLARGKVDSLVLLLQSPTEYVWIPRKVALQDFLHSRHRNRYHVWQFRVLRMGGETLLRSRPTRPLLKDEVFDYTRFSNIRPRE